MRSGIEANGRHVTSATSVRYEGDAITPGADVANLVEQARHGDQRAWELLYRRLYPLFQQAYEELGYPGRYFNDRVVEVIDQLLATPEVPGPIKVKLVEVKPARPGGGLYQFEDPALEARTSGQKIMLRIGPENARKLKAKLTEIRQQIAKSGAARELTRK